jgi:hypothetical protein
MKRLASKYKETRNKYNNIETKLFRYTSVPFFLLSFPKLRNFCVSSYYSKNVLSKFHLSSKSLKMFFRQGMIFG